MLVDYFWFARDPVKKCIQGRKALNQFQQSDLTLVTTELHRCPVTDNPVKGIDYNCARI